MSRDHRQLDERVLTGQRVQVRPADADRLGAHPELARARRDVGHRGELDRPLLRDDDRPHGPIILLARGEVYSGRGAGALLHRPGARRSPGRTTTRSTRSSRSCRPSWPARGHRVLVLAPSRSPELVRESRRLIRSAREAPEELFAADGEVRVLGVGEVLPFNRRGQRAVAAGRRRRTIEEALALAPLDFVHVHEPFAPEHRRRSRCATRARSTSAPSTRRPSGCSRPRSRAASSSCSSAASTPAPPSFEATRELMERYFPAEYRVLRPGADADRARASATATAACGSRSARRRSAPRCGCSCARCGGCRTTSTGRRRCSRPPARRRPARCAAASATA